jgi:GDP-L-fucose synthase
MYGLKDNYNLNDSHVIPGLIHKTYLAKLNNTDLEVWGSGKAQREFIFAPDVADLLSIMSKMIALPQEIIISPGVCYSIQEVVENIVKNYGFQKESYF